MALKSCLKAQGVMNGSDEGKPAAASSMTPSAKSSTTVGNQSVNEPNAASAAVSA